MWKKSYKEKEKKDPAPIPNPSSYELHEHIVLFFYIEYHVSGWLHQWRNQEG